MSTLSLKIYLPDTDTIKTCQYLSDMYVHDVIRDVREKHSYGEAGLDFGLLLREQSLWLAPNKLLDHYDLKTGDTLEFRKRHRVLKVKTLDESIKAILIDESQPIRIVVAAVCERIGIANVDEYSLAVERAELQPKKGEKKPKPKEAVYTDGKTWLNPEKTLREHGLTEGDIVVLKKKFFFTDQNVDRSDPVQMMLMYNQTHEMIVSGKHPCTATEAVQLAAIQLQIHFGNHEPDKHKPGFIKTKGLVPPEYHKNKDIEKKIYIEHSKLQGMTEVNAKFRYVQMCRSLKTYGTTYFVVKEPATKKKKAVTVLLGITKQNIVRVDLETKETLMDWKLTQVRRWSATSKTFTLDFGDYSENYYSVETVEGEEISRLIAGYVDIIVKKRNQKAQVVEESRVVEQAVMEDYVRPGRANNVEVVANVGGGARKAKESHLTSGFLLDEGHGAGDRQKAGNRNTEPHQGEIAQNLDSIEFQQAITQIINNGIAVSAAAFTDLSTPTHLPLMSSDPAIIKWRQETCDITGESISSNIAASLAAVGALVIHATGNTEEMDYNTIGAKLFTVISTIGQITQGVKILSGLQSNETDQEKLLAAAKQLTEAMSKVLRDLQPIISGSLMMDEFYGATRSLAFCSTQALKMIDHLDITEDQQQQLFKCADEVTNAVAEAVDRIKNLATTIRDPEMQKLCLSDSIMSSEIAAMLTAVTVILAPAVHTPLCRELLTEGSVLMQEGALALLSYSDQTNNQKMIDQLQSAVENVEKTLLELLDRARFSDGSGERDIEVYYNEIVVALDQLVNDLQHPENVIASTKLITISATRLAEVLKIKAETLTDPNSHEILMDDARVVSELTARMVANAKEIIKNPCDSVTQEEMEDLVGEFKNAVDGICGSFIKASLTQKLVQSMRSTMASSNQLMASSRNCSSFNRDQGSQIYLNRAIKKVVADIPKAVQAIKSSIANPNDHIACVRLMQTGRVILEPMLAMVETARIAALTTVDSDAQQLLLAATQQLADELHQLGKILEIYEQITAAEEMMGAEMSLKATLFDLSKARIVEGSLPLTITPADYNASDAEKAVSQSTKSIQNSLELVLAAVRSGGERAAGTVITDMIENIQTLSTATIRIASNSSDLSHRQEILDCTTRICESVSNVIQTTRQAFAENKGDVEVEYAMRDTVDAIKSTLECLPEQRKLLLALENIRLTTNEMALPKTISSSDSALRISGSMQEEMQTKLVEAAIALAAVTNAMVISSNFDSKNGQGNMVKIDTAFESLAVASVTLAGLRTSHSGSDGEDGKEVTGMVRSIGLECDQFLSLLMGSKQDPEDSSLTGRLLSAAKSIGGTVDDLLVKLAVSVPGYDQCSQAMQTIGASTVLLKDTNNVFTIQGTYSETVDNMTSAEADLMEILSVMSAHANAQNGPKVADTLVELADTVGKYTEQTLYAAQLIAQSDPSYESPISPPIDRELLSSAYHDLAEACKRLVNENTTQKEILQCASIISKQTTAINNLCKLASQDPKLTPEAQQGFIKFTKEMSLKTVELVSAIKLLAVKNNTEARVLCTDVTKRLTDTVEDIIKASGTSKHIGPSAKMSEQILLNQRPVFDHTELLLSELRSITLLSQTFCTNPDRDDLRLQLITETDAVSKIVGNMLTSVKEAGPGQKVCQDATDRINDTMVSIDTAIVKAATNKGECKDASATKSADKVVLQDHLQALSNLSEVVSRSARGDMIQLTSAIEEMPLTLNKAATVVIGYAASIDVKLQQRELLESTRALSDALAKYVSIIKADCVDPNDFGTIQIEVEKVALKEAIASVVAIIEGPSDPHTLEIIHASETIEMLLTDLDSKVSETIASLKSLEGGSEKPYQMTTVNMKSSGKQLIVAVGHVLSKQCKMEELPLAATRLSSIYEELVAHMSAAMHATDDEDLGKMLFDLTREVGGSILKVVQVLRQGSGKETLDASMRLKLSQAVRLMSGKLEELNNAAQSGSKGVIACQAVCSSLDDVIAEFETNCIFAEAQQLDPTDASDRFSFHKEQLLLAVKSLADSTSGFANCHRLTQDELARMVAVPMSAMNVFKEQMNKGVMSISAADSSSQVQLLKLGKAIATSVQMLVKTAGNAAGMADNSACAQDLKDAAQQQQESVQALYQFVEMVDNDSQRVIKGLDCAIDGIDEACRILNDKSVSALGTALPTEVMFLARSLAGAAAAVIGSATISSKSDSLVTLTMNLRKIIQDLARTGKAAIDKAPDDKKVEVITAITHASNACRDLIVGVKDIQTGSTSDAKMQLQLGAKAVTVAVTEVVSASGKLVPDGYVDSKDPNVVAERELLSAANAIEAAAKRLAEFRPTEGPRKANADLNFDEQILEAAKAIAAATSALVRSATGTQREIMARGRAGQTDSMYFSDGTWSDGLVSAARLVAASTSDLCDAANDAVKGNVQRDRVIVCAKNVSSSTVQLLTAAAVRSDPTSQAQIRLRAAGKAVTDATEMLVEAAKCDSSGMDEEEEENAANLRADASSSATRAKVLEMEAQMNILRMEKELERARVGLAAVRKGRYTTATSSSSVSGGDPPSLAGNSLSKSHGGGVMGGTTRSGTTVGARSTTSTTAVGEVPRVTTTGARGGRGRPNSPTRQAMATLRYQTQLEELPSGGNDQ
ncbi:hypothetical protein BASA50_007534 [Batrachochytrium salamandrivorans]|uniref:FERM domain-containing protein n=1 Tax=Batrachochytrium salamandrivorans TaxID=1357716 RepID=A0ABQ8FA67_9FUNG|nr:hypothetical protein BASA62_002057 [Batrachochytrium salamandrivorans]KAH6593326.1 hypothetical protein BASA50_007534 [Batrachochytrium salamandrivorans]